MLDLTPQQWGYFTLRLTLGVNMLMHGLSRILTGVGAFAEKMAAGFAEVALMPMALVKGYLVALPFVELVIGVMMVLGLFTRYALIAGALLITSLTFGSTAKQDWGAAGSQLVYAVAFAILLFGLEFNRLRVRD